MISRGTCGTRCHVGEGAHVWHLCRHLWHLGRHLWHLGRWSLGALGQKSTCGTLGEALGHVVTNGTCAEESWGTCGLGAFEEPTGHLGEPCEFGVCLQLLEKRCQGLVPVLVLRRGGRQRLRCCHSHLHREHAGLLRLLEGTTGDPLIWSSVYSLNIRLSLRFTRSESSGWSVM